MTPTGGSGSAAPRHVLAADPSTAALAAAVPPETVLAVLNGIPGMVGYWDRTLRNHLANAAYLRFFGWTPEAMVGVHIREVLGETLFRANLPYMQQALDGREVMFDRTLTDAEGRTHHTQASYLPDRRDGVVHGFFVLVTDISDRVLAEQGLEKSLDTWRALARSLPRGFVLVLDTDLRFVVADGAELGTYGFAREELEGRTLEETFPPDLVELLEPRYRAALAGESISWERTFGHRTFAMSAGPVLTDGASPGDPSDRAMVIAQDVTEQRITERIWAAQHMIATEVALKTSPEEIAQRVGEALIDVFRVDTSAVVRYTGTGRADVLAMAPVHLPDIPETVSFSPDDATTTARVFATGEPVLAQYAPDGGSLAETVAATGLRTGAGSPIRYQGRLWGAIVLASNRPDGLDASVLAPLQRFAELVELAIGTTESWEALARQAGHDELTGLPNRRTFNARLEREVEHAERHGQALSVAMLDLDRFKAVNDEFGHAVGDSVLSELGERLRTVSRGAELVARLGGEEFAWVLPGSDATTALQASERLRRDIAALKFAEAGRLTISIGVSTLQPGLDASALLERADQGLYAAKRAGRDRVVHVRDLG